jgi:hypothetical protein
LKRGIIIEQGKPLLTTFVELRDALSPLHIHQKAWVDSLHDVWKKGAPTPDSIIRSPKGYDERLRQAGNVEKRIVLPTPLADWIMQVSAARGTPVNFKQAMRMVNGEADFGFETRRNDS